MRKTEVMRIHACAEEQSRSLRELIVRADAKGRTEMAEVVGAIGFYIERLGNLLEGEDEMKAALCWERDRAWDALEAADLPLPAPQEPRVLTPPYRPAPTAGRGE